MDSKFNIVMTVKYQILQQWLVLIFPTLLTYANITFKNWGCISNYSFTVHWIYAEVKYLWWGFLENSYLFLAANNFRKKLPHKCLTAGPKYISDT